MFSQRFTVQLPPSHRRCLALKVSSISWLLGIYDLLTPFFKKIYFYSQVGTPKYVANKMKSKGLQRLRWYCQVCEKQCRDENGFKCHAASESHLRQMLVVGEHAGSHIAGFSNQFQSEFVSLLSRRQVAIICPTFFFIKKIKNFCIGLERSVCAPTRSIKNISLTRAIFI